MCYNIIKERERGKPFKRLKGVVSMRKERKNYMDGIDFEDVVNGIVIGLFVVMVLICIGSCIF